jgi:hypothetical protein
MPPELDTDAMSGPASGGPPSKPPDDAMSRRYIDSDPDPTSSASEGRPRSRAKSAGFDAPPTIEQAFQQAKEEHAKPADEDEEEQTEQPAARTRGKDGRFQGTAGEPAGASEPQPPVGDEAGTEEAAAEPLVSEEEFKGLQAKYAKQPELLLKELNKAFTQKTQALSAERKVIERLEPYVDVIESFEQDPTATIAALAEQQGFDLVPRGTAPPTGQGNGHGQTLTQPAPTDVEEFRKVLGPDLEYLAEPLAPAVTTLIDRKVQAALAAALGPVQHQQQAVIQHVAEEQTAAVMKAFEAKHADWNQHEAAMFDLAQRIEPKGMTELEFLEHLYTIATRTAWEKDKEAKIADGVKQALKRLQRGADTTERRTQPTPNDEVIKGPPRDRAPSFAEAYEAAKRGERWE